MTSIEALKEQARRHEQKEEWRKALDQYKKAIRQLEAEDQPDIGLYNRVGDLYVRVGRLDDAVHHYGRAFDLYMESDLPNNAIAVCKKIIRNVPDRHDAYLKMGQIRAQQGFLSDARTNFLTYADRMQQAGNLDESFRALVEFSDLAPDDVGVRLAVADQMATHQRTEEAVQQLAIAYAALTQKGEEAQAESVEARMRELDPDIDVEHAVAVALAGDQDAEEEAPEAEAFGDTDLGGFEIGSGVAIADEEAVVETEEMPGFETTHVGMDAEEPDAVESDVEVVGNAPGEVGLEEAAVEEEEEEEAFELPLIRYDEEEEAEEEQAVEEEAPTLEALRARVARNPDDTELHQRMVETAYRTGDEEALAEAYLGLAEALQRAGQTARARAAFQLVLDHDPENTTARAALGDAAATSGPPKEVAARDDYVDLGSLVLEDEAAKTTRFVVAYEEPSGDEQADFAKMLSQFKNKVSEGLDADDVKAHHDLGTAYKEMGLLDEAVVEFQQALRASSSHLPTYELLGQTFLEMGKTDAAIRSLERAIEVDHEIEDELIAIYYHLARAYEDAGEKARAVEFYDRVFSLDINFADVTERLRALR